MADYFQKAGIHFKEKTAFKDRANPLIDQTHAGFLEMEQYFQRLLRQTNYTIEEILENTFEPHEILLFTPVSGFPELNQLQNNSALRFQNLLATRFKGRASTLQLKMAMLYFGLPVAPMRPGAYQMPVPTDLDFGEDATIFRPDPLQFLDDYTARTYGDSSKRVTSTHFLQNPPTQTFASLKIRGGAAPDATEMGKPEAEEEEDEWGEEGTGWKWPEPAEVEDRPQGKDGLYWVWCRYEYGPETAKKNLGPEGNDWKRPTKLEADNNRNEGWPDFIWVRTRYRYRLPGDAEGEGDKNGKNDGKDKDDGKGKGDGGGKGDGEEGVEEAANGDEDEDEDYWGLYIYGFQGMFIVPNYYETFVNAVDYLLSSRYGFDYSIRLQIWQIDGDNHQFTEETSGTIFHDRVPDKDDPIYGLLAKYVSKRSALNHYFAFVCYDKETPPSQHLPRRREEICLINYREEKGPHGKIWPDARMGYMRLPVPTFRTHKSNQFISQYQQTMDFLYPERLHHYIQFFSDEKSDNPISVSYGILDPSPKVWREIIKAATTGEEAPEYLYFLSYDIPPNYIPLIVPGFHINNPALADDAESTFTLEDLSIRHSAEDNKSVAKLTNAVYEAYEELKDAKDFALDVWIPGEDFTNTRIAGQRINIQPDDISVAPIDWSTLVHNFRRTRLYANKEKLSVVIRPAFEKYTVYSTVDDKKSIETDINTTTLADFKKEAEKLVAGYKGNQKGHILHLTQTAYGKNENDFAVTFDMDEQGWKLITRRITERQIGITFETWDSDEPVNEKSEFGQRYRAGDRPTTVYKDPKRKEPLQPFSKPMNKLFEASSNNLTGIARAAALRSRFFAADPSIFTNPAKPAMPLHAPPIETIISTGPNVPAFTTAVRTPTEMARLEKEVHKLRGSLLGRIKECPYLDCKRWFSFADGEKLDRHLREDHKVLQCFLCPDGATQVPQYDAFTIRSHFLDVHFDEMQEFFGIAPYGAAGEHHCSRCGRDESRLSNPDDVKHHDAVCQITDLPGTPTWCCFCGNERDEDAEPCECGFQARGPNDIGLYCDSCGLQYTKSMSQAYRELHRRLCQRPGGQPEDYCPNCGGDLTDFTGIQKQWHIDECGVDSDSPDGGAGAGANADNISAASGVALGKSALATRASRRRAASRAASRTTNSVNFDINDVLDLVSDSERRNPQKASRLARARRQITRKSPALDPRIRESATTKRDTDSSGRREDSPDWDAVLEPGYKYGKFMPEPQWRCSRCFRCAGFEAEEIEGHMDETGSCMIRRGLGTTEGVPLPNRSGWIADDTFDFHEAYFAFVKKYPRYRYTMFPTHDENVDQVWKQPYTLEASIGEIEDDPNYYGHNAQIESLRARYLPWPPYAGRWIPGDENKSVRVPRPDKLAGESDAAWHKRRVAGMTLQDRNIAHHMWPQIVTKKDLDSEYESTVRTPLTELSDGPELAPFSPAPWTTLTETSSSRTPRTTFTEASTRTPRTPLTELSNPDPNSDSEVDSEDEDVDLEEDFLSSSNFSSEVTSIVTSNRDWDPEVDPETRSERRKRRRRDTYDPSFTAGTVSTGTDLDEEYSEYGAVPDPIANLDPDAPPTPRVRPSKKAKKSHRDSRPAAPETPLRPISDDLSGFGLPSSKAAQGLRPTSSGRRSVASVSTPLTSFTLPSLSPGASASFGGAGRLPVFGMGRAGSMPPPASARSHTSASAPKTRPSTSQSATSGRSSWDSSYKTARSGTSGRT
ncbi:hypothetical protein GGR53DRAFT_302236 [Hypoxylon sp. FL1150]|nr:hypothetical protein GGR53DRAFT_302236 [Hypoxylon sp. FL1150]